MNLNYKAVETQLRRSAKDSYTNGVLNITDNYTIEHTEYIQIIDFDASGKRSIELEEGED